uniref:hypothetical protein n=1 Tax=Prevotella sp. TaxID=59823 RepID=UPI004027BF3B
SYPLSCDFWKEMCYASGTHQKSRFLLSQFRIPDDADFLSGSDMIFSFSARTAQSIRVELCNFQ